MVIRQSLLDPSADRPAEKNKAQLSIPSLFSPLATFMPPPPTSFRIARSAIFLQEST
ncbi:MAG: hypothetical protein IPO69_00105 [Saprospiraceae bacterium]|nr:hypothetical protein [Saprospiraceae bacterium]